MSMKTSTMSTIDSTTPNPSNPDPALFTELVSRKMFRHYNIGRPDPDTTQLYFIRNCETLRKSKFDLTVHRGTSQEGEILGVTKRHRKGWTIGIGNPAGEIEGKAIPWEELGRPEKFSHKVYFFDFGTGAQRKTYTWRKSYATLRRLKSMDLRVGGVDDEEGELVARWVNSSRWSMKVGSLFIKRDAAMGLDQDGSSTGVKPSEWERVAFLTAFSIIESQVRRSKG